MMPTNDYNHSAFGLRIKSCLEIPGAKKVSESQKNDVVILYGNVPENLKSFVSKGPCYQVNTREILLKIKNVAHFLIKEGIEIVIQPAQHAKEEEIQLFLLGNAMGALLHQRGLLPIHGSGIQVKTEAVLITGASGSGKSTLAAALEAIGYPVLCDDIAAIGLDPNGIPVLYPSFPRIHLWNDVVEKFNITGQALQAVRPSLKKYSFSIEDKFHTSPLPVKRIYCLTAEYRTDFNIDPVSAFDKIELIKANTFRTAYIAGPKSTTRHFQLCLALSKHSEVRKITRPVDPLLVHPLVGILEKEFKVQ